MLCIWLILCTVDDLKARFDRHVAELTKGKDASMVRIVME